MTRPTVQELAVNLKDLVRWKTFAIHLPAIEQTDIDTIESASRDDTVDQKLRLYDMWLRVYPEASWEDVIMALEKAKENKIAKSLREKFHITETVMSLKKPEGLQELLEISSKTRDPVLVADEVVEELDNLHSNFLSLTEDVREGIKEKATRSPDCLDKFVQRVKDIKTFTIDFPSSVKDTDQFFEAIRPHYDFLNPFIVVHLAQKLGDSIAKKAKLYSCQSEDFMKRTEIKDLHDKLKPYCGNFGSSKAVVRVEISVQNAMGTQSVFFVKQLIRTLFFLKPSDPLLWVEVVREAKEFVDLKRYQILEDEVSSLSQDYLEKHKILSDKFSSLEQKTSKEKDHLERYTVLSEKVSSLEQNMSKELSDLSKMSLAEYDYLKREMVLKQDYLEKHKILSDKVSSLEQKTSKEVVDLKQYQILEDNVSSHSQKLSELHKMSLFEFEYLRKEVALRQAEGTALKRENFEIETSNHSTQFGTNVPMLDLTHGAVVAGERMFVFGGESQPYYEWEECGLVVHVPEYGVPPLSTCEMRVSALAGGDFLFPDGHELVSAVYAVTFSHSLQKDVVLELQHCVDLQIEEDTDCLSFAVASPLASPGSYTFSLVKGGRFSVRDRYGSIEASESFCYCILMRECNRGGNKENKSSNGKKERKGRKKNHQSGKDNSGSKGKQGATGDSGNPSSEDNANPSEDKTTNRCCYVCQTFVAKKLRRSWDAEVVFAKDLNVLKKYIARNSHSNMEPQGIVPFHFNKDSLTLNIPDDCDGWRVVPVVKHPYKICRENIDLLGNKRPAQPFPSKYMAFLQSTSEILVYSLTMNGIEEEGLTLNIVIDNTKVGESGSEEDDCSMPPRKRRHMELESEDALSSGVLDKKPSLKDALNVLRNISTEWDDIGRELDVSFNLREGWERDSLTNKKRLERVLNTWLVSECHTPVTWRELIKILKSPELCFTSTARNVEEFLQTKNAQETYK